jgi:hypothetical protein
MITSWLFQRKHPLHGFVSGVTDGKVGKQRAGTCMHFWKTRFYANVGRCMTKTPIPTLA